jgi:large subunit ribosomal protein L3
MPGHLGLDNCTIQNLKVMQVREGEKLLLVRGAIPGANGSVVIVRDAKKVAIKA